MTPVLVTGATGNVGSNVVRELRRRGVPARAFVRDAKTAAALLGSGVDLAVGDLAEPDSIRRSLEGIDHVFLACGNVPGQVELEMNVIDAARATGVRRVVKLSTHTAQVGSPVAFWDWQGRIEEHLRASGVPWVLLHASFYMSNVLAAAEAVRRSGKLFAPAAGARIAMIDPRDVASAAATVLAEDGHEGSTYELTGPAAITYEDVARDLTEVTGRPIDFVAVPDEAARRGMVESGVPEWFADVLVLLFGYLREGAAEGVTDMVRALTSRAPRRFVQFARDHARLFVEPVAGAEAVRS